jgi:PEP-CTERM motif
MAAPKARARLRLLVGATILAGTVPLSSFVQAETLTVSDPFLQWYNVGPNDLSFSAGEFIRSGATDVVPNGFNGTIGTASTTNLSTGAPIVRTLNPLTSAVTPNFFNNLLTICTTSCSPTGNNNPANLAGPWTLAFSNPIASNSPVSDVISLAGSGEIPFVSSVTLSGTSALPTFSWTPPTGIAVDGYRINIYENDLQTFDSTGKLINTGQVTSANVPPSVTSYTVQPSDFSFGVALKNNTTYTIEISALQTRNGSTTDLSNGNVSAISRVYSSFQTLPTGTPPVNLPTVTRVGGELLYSFNLTVQPGITYSIDPSVATGYIYQTGTGNPNFASVELPNIGNPGPYDLYLWNGTSFVFDTTLGPSKVFDFAAGGVSEFKVLGIDPSLGLDPENPTAFITDLTFEGAGDFTGTMTPVTATIPEPSTWAMMLAGFAGLGLLAHRSRKRAATGA